MTALAADRITNISKRDGVRYVDPVAASALIYAGALVVLNASGYATKGSTATGLIARGVAVRQVDNSSGADGDEDVETEAGVFDFINNGGITRAHIGDLAYIVDDQTVAETDGGGTRSAAGTIKDIDSVTGRVFVKVG